ncbi:MAG: hypothetical protein COA52_03035 [Hyphomicrobiales bacterium]|nr:MAG: hypothetical protein COA52_03035 [Hyphomicrobiales bacterium]
MEAIIGMIVQAVAGGVGGGGIGKMLEGANMGTAGNAIVGAIGGLVSSYIAAKIPGLEGMLGGMAGGEGSMGGGMDFGALLGQGATGLVGGGILTTIVGMLKNKMG